MLATFIAKKLNCIQCIHTNLIIWQILQGKPRIDGRPGETIPPLDFAKVREGLQEQFGKNVRGVDVISAALYPKVTEEYLEFKEKYGPVDALDTKLFLVGPKVAQEFEVPIFCLCSVLIQMHA